jgi:hypothetical protein
VLGHRGLRDAVLGPDDVDDVARGRLAVGEELEDAAPDGIAQHVERVHGDNISDLTYMTRRDARPRTITPMSGELALGTGVGAIIQAISDLPTGVLVLVAMMLFVLGAGLFRRGD